MLLILYGSVAEVGDVSRNFFIQSGFDLIKKYSYAPEKPRVNTYYGEREYVDEQTFYENTDSLFRFEMAGIRMGFNLNQISDAVCNKTNALLTLSASDISCLSEIKRIYQENVCIVYVYIDEQTLKNMVCNLEGIDRKEISERLKIGMDVRENYAKNPQLFDKVVIFGGEQSVFNKQMLKEQYKSIITPIVCAKEEHKEYADVFISYTFADKEIYSSIVKELSERNISVFLESTFINFQTGGYMEQLKDAMQHAKIFIPIITDGSLKSKYFRSEVLDMDKIEMAKINAVAVVPFVVGKFAVKADDDDANFLMSYLLLYNCVIAYEGQTEKYAAELADLVQKLLSAQDRLKELSKQVNNYRCLRMYETALNLQKEHMKLCDEVYKFAKEDDKESAHEVCLMSRSEIADILLDMSKTDDALDYVIGALNSDCSSLSPNYQLASQFAICCVRKDMTGEEVSNLIKKDLKGAKFVEGNFYIPEGEQYLNELLKYYNEEKQNPTSTAPKHVYLTPDSDMGQIAQYGELAIDMFDALLQSENKSVCDHDLIIGYERILNYCKYVGLKGDIAEKCIQRIAELKANAETAEGISKSAYSDSLKLYLGQALPMAREYDAFISFKSEDEALARKVYDHLVQLGKEVFFSEVTITEVGETKYKEIIDEALDRSRHLVLVSSNPEYLKTQWVKYEWNTFSIEKLDGRKSGNIVLVLTDDISRDKGSLPIDLRKFEIVKMSEFRTRLLSYLR